MLEALLGNLVEITLSVAAVIVVLLLLSPLLGRKYTAKWRYYIWLVLALRLLVPFNFSLPGAPIRLEPRQQISTAAPESYAPQAPSKAPQDPAPVPPPIQEADADIKLAHVLCAVWALGAAVFLAWQAVGYCRFARFVRRWESPAQIPDMLHQLCLELQIRADVRLAICPKLQSPMMTGLMHPVILLPHENYSTESLYFVLRHELTHLKRCDLWYKLLLMAANAVHWFNPLVYLMVREANKDVEFSCDDAVVAGMSAENRGKYGDTILSAVRAGQRGASAFSTYFYGGKGTVKKRLANLFDSSKKRKGTVALCVVLVVACVAGGLFACEMTAQQGSIKMLLPEQLPLSLARRRDDPNIGKNPIFWECTVGSNVRSMILYLEEYHNGRLVGVTGKAVLQVKGQRYIALPSVMKFPQGGKMDWVMASCDIEGSGSTVSWSTQLPDSLAYRLPVPVWTTHVQANERQIVLDEPILLQSVIVDQRDASEEDKPKYNAMRMQQDEEALVQELEYVYLFKCMFSQKWSEFVPFPEVQPPSAQDGELAIASLANSVLYNKAAGELEFQTPQAIPESCKLYIHVSGRTLTQDGIGMSWHAYEEETETFDWGLNQTYFAYITPEDIDFIEITVGLVEEKTGEMRYETVISVDAQGNVSDNKSYRPIGAKSGPEVFEVLPAMTEENERFARQYLQPALYSGLLFASFSPGNYEQLDTYTKEGGNMTGSPVLLHFFEDVTGQDQMLKLLIEYYSSEGVADLPADLVETTLLQYFELTKAQLHAVMSHYEPATNTYRYSGARGGGEVNVVVTGSRKDGDLLLLDYNLFSGPPGNFRKMLAGISTIRVEQDGYKYVANEMNHVTEGTGQ